MTTGYVPWSLFNAHDWSKFNAPRHPKPFIWTTKANDILQKVIRANRQLGSKKNEALP